jgi:hypothetical protein
LAAVFCAVSLILFGVYACQNIKCLISLFAGWDGLTFDNGEDDKEGHREQGEDVESISSPRKILSKKNQEDKHNLVELSGGNPKSF